MSRFMLDGFAWHGWRKKPRALLALGPAGAAMDCNGVTQIQRFVASPGNVAADAAVLATLLAQAGGRITLDVAVDDRMVRSCVVTPPQGVAHLSELKAVAALRMEALFDVTSEGWCLSAAWNAQQPFLCCALPRVLLDALSQAAATADAQVRSIAPLYVRVCNDAHGVKPLLGWMVVRCATSVSAAYFGGGGVCHAVRSAVVHAGADVSDWMRRCAWASGHAFEPWMVLDTASADAAPAEQADRMWMSAQRPDVALLHRLTQDEEAA